MYFKQIDDFVKLSNKKGTKKMSFLETSVIKGGTKKTGQLMHIEGYGGFYYINVVMKLFFASKFCQNSEYFQFLGVGALWKHPEPVC